LGCIWPKEISAMMVAAGFAGFLATYPSAVKKMNLVVYSP
jgi:hypothetical protein